MNESHGSIIDTRLIIDNITKSYGLVQALAGISLEVGPGERVGILGPNGAGKSTWISIIAGLIRPDSGSVRLSGSDDPVDRKRRLGMIPEEPHLYPYLTGREHLRLSQSFRRIPEERVQARITRLSDVLEIQPVLDRPVSTYSHGMRQKLTILLALYHEPALILVDEPMVGLDIYAQVAVKELLREESERGRIILLSTHTLPLVEEISSRVVILDRGRIISEGRPADLVGERSLEDFFRLLRSQGEGGAAPQC